MHPVLAIDRPKIQDARKTILTRRRGQVRVERSVFLIQSMWKKKTYVFNFLTHEQIALTPLRSELLLHAESGLSAERLIAKCGKAASAAARKETARLLQKGFLVLEGSAQARMQADFLAEWQTWDLRAGMFHLAIKDPPIQPEVESGEALSQQVATQEWLPLYETNPKGRTTIRLAKVDPGRDPFKLLLARRTRRTLTEDSISLAAVADCLVAGLGITQFAVGVVKGHPALPLKMTPSGGARNPYEAYLYARRVDGLEPGLYHYSACENSLARVPCDDLPTPSAIISDQSWGDGVAAMIVLVADFRRTMWKYGHPQAYRSVLIEAGHIGQNMMLAATANGLSSIPTAFLRDALVEQTLGLNRITQSAVYSVSLGVARSSRLDYGRVVPNRAVV